MSIQRTASLLFLCRLRSSTLCGTTTSEPQRTTQHDAGIIIRTATSPPTEPVHYLGQLGESPSTTHLDGVQTATVARRIQHIGSSDGTDMARYVHRKHRRSLPDVWWPLAHDVNGEQFGLVRGIATRDGHTNDTSDCAKVRRVCLQRNRDQTALTVERARAHEAWVRTVDLILVGIS
eukprot:scaffold31681_cov30-Tisochrysis_lutea.AAC.2